SAPGSEIFAPFFHQPYEPRFIAFRHQAADAGDRFAQCIQRIHTELVQVLDLEVQVRVVLGNRGRYQQLRIEGGGGQPRKLRRRFAAFRKRGEERDVERVRKTEDVGDQAIVIVETHLELLDHGRGE